MSAPLTVFGPGDRVTWNARGTSLFGATKSSALVVAIEKERAHLLWETGQETWASVSCLQRVPEVVKGGADQ